MQREVLLPQVELTMESALVAKWLVRPGDQVRAEQPILEVETQKATSEIPSPAAGYVRQLCVEEGQSVGEKALLCILTDTADEPFRVSTATAGLSGTKLPEPGPSRVADTEAEAGLVKASPAARRTARELNIDLSALRGTGPGGRVTEQDVRAAATADTGTKASNEAWSPIPATRLALIAQMQKSLAEIPQIQVRRRLDVTSLLANKDGITFTHRLARAVAAALSRHPSLRTTIDANRVRVEPVSVAIAMDSPHGLIAPVVRNADQLSLRQLSEAVQELRAKADANALHRADLTNAPFAISNLGMFGVDQFDAFVFHGQTAVLSVGRAADDRADGKLAWFSLAVDHRVVDGAEAARFLETLQAEISSP
ncbi:MAG: dihydrolipoamide acetyltransferase family protein [Pirellulales bacterium]